MRARFSAVAHLPVTRMTIASVEAGGSVARA